MTFTVANYFNQPLDVQSLPATLAESHQFFSEAVEYYNDDATVKETIDLYLAKLNQYLASQASGKKTGKKKAAKAAFVPKSRGKKPAAKPTKKSKSSFVPQSRGSYNPLPIKGQIKEVTGSPIKIRPGAKPRYWDTVSDSFQVLVPETIGTAKVEVGFSTAGKIRHQFVYRQIFQQGLYSVEVFDAMSGLSMGYYDDDDQKSAFVRAHDNAVDNLNEQLIRSHIRDHGVAPIYVDENQAAINFEVALPSYKRSKSSFKPKSRGKQPTRGKFKKNDLVYYTDSGKRHSIKEVEKLDKDEVVYIMENGDRKIARELTIDKPKPAKPKAKPATEKAIAEAVKEAVAQGPPILTNPHITKKMLKRAEKAVKAVNAAKAKKEKPASQAKGVKSITREVAFFKRYVNMNGKERTYTQVLKLVTDLQKAINSGEILKASPYSDDMYLLQENLLKALKGNKNQLIRMVNKEENLAKWVQIAGGEKVFASINLLRSYLNMQGKEPVVERIESLLSKARKADLSEDPYEDRVKKMIRNLEKALEKKTSVEIEQVELSGLSGMMGHLTAGSARPRGRQSSEEMMSRQHESIGLTGKYARLLGDPEVGAQVLIHGLPGQGKTTFSLQVARHLAIEHGPTLYVSGEESGSVTLQEKLKKAGGATKNLTFDDHVPHDVHEFDFLFLDSVQSLDFKLEDMAKLKKENPRLTIFFILQSTKAGNFKGGQGWAHDVDVLIEVANGEAFTTKNRYKSPATITIW